MAALMDNTGYILANELDSIRCERLKFNIEKQGVKIAEVSNDRGENIGKKYVEYFDKVLLDAPCSGEGRFIANDPKTYRSWSIRTVKELSKLQKKLFKSAYTALRKGGELVYSTCTLNKFENEEVLNWAFNQFNMEIVKIEIELKNTLKGITKGYNNELKNAIRMLPTKEQEGFFVAKLIKK